MNVSLPEDLKRFVDAQVDDGTYGSTSEYVRELIQRDYACRQLRDALLEGARSQISETGDSDYFSTLRTQAQALT